MIDIQFGMSPKIYVVSKVVCWKTFRRNRSILRLHVSRIYIPKVDPKNTSTCLEGYRCQDVIDC
jgi:hypothetical protein